MSCSRVDHVCPDHMVQEFISDDGEIAMIYFETKEDCVEFNFLIKVRPPGNYI